MSDTPSQPEAAPLPYAGLVDRVMGGLVDIAIITLLVAVPVGIIMLLTGEGAAAGGAIAWFLVAVVLGYLVVGGLYTPLLMASRMQATVGMRLVGIRICDISGRRLGLSQSYGRFILQYILTVIPAVVPIISAVTVVTTERAQTVWDMLARTVVVSTK